MVCKSIITEDSYFFKKGQIVEGDLTKNGLLVEEHFISKDSFILLNEALTSQDEEKIKYIVRELIKRLFYRMYVRSSFLLK